MTPNPIFKFEDAERIKLKASIMIEGLTGTGKSGLALLLSKYLAGSWDKVFHIDTENKSANLFADLPFSDGQPVGKFKVGQLTEDIGYKPSNYLAFRLAAIQAGASVVIEDSISHAWQYKGGLLDLVNEATAKSTKNDKYAAWRDDKVASEKHKLMDLIRCPDVHVITTVRVKEKFDYVDDGTGKNKLQSLGEQQIQQADLKYEPDLVLHMVHPGQGPNTPPRALVVKSRYAILQKDVEYDFTPELCIQLKAYLEEGADPTKLLEEQRQDYITAIKEYLDAHQNKVPIWNVMKKDAGYESIKLEDIDLKGCKDLYLVLTTN